MAGMPTSIRWEQARLPLALAAFAAVAAVLAYRIVVIPDAWILMDFRTNLYYPALALLEGHDPYDVAALVQRYPIAPPIPPYAPLMLLAHAPLALLPVGVAQLVYVAFSMGLVLVLAALALRAARLPHDAATVLGLGTLVLASRPGSMNVFLGQPTLIVVLAVSVALLESRTRPVLAAIGVAFATGKPQFGVPLALILAACGATRVAVAGVLLSGAVTVVTLLAIAHGDLGAMVDMLASLPRNATHIDDLTFTWWSRVDLPYLASHVAGGRVGRLAELGLAALVLGIAVTAIRSGRTGANLRSPRALLVSTLALLLAVYHQAYDALLLSVPVLTLFAEWHRDPRPAHTIVRRVVLGLLLLPAVNYVATYSTISRLGITGEWWHVITAVNGLALLAVFVACAFVPVRIAERSSQAAAAADVRSAWTAATPRPFS